MLKANIYFKNGYKYYNSIVIEKQAKINDTTFIIVRNPKNGTEVFVNYSEIRNLTFFEENDEYIPEVK